MYNFDEFKEKNYFIAEIYGKECLSLNSFLDSIARAFKFPDYYGRNINALWDLIGDLSWLNESNYLLVIRESGFFLKDENENTRRDIYALLERIAEDWRNVPNFENEDQFRKRSDFRVIYDAVFNR
jgi:RNAse (barnase) inhibitor barstar